MDTLYDVAQISCQAFNKWLRTIQSSPRLTDAQIVEMARKVRKEHLPGSSARVVYSFLRQNLTEESSKLKRCGKHTFERICLANGMRIEFRRFVPKTTERGDFVYKNLVSGTILNDINQVWVSDISYIFGDNGKLVGYSTTIIDLYSKRLLGLEFSETMRASHTVQQAFNKASKSREISTYKDLIFHSDGGKQYIEGNFIKTLRDHGIQSSMAENCFENASAEAFNDTLKNHMLIEFTINSIYQLKQLESKLTHCYNNNKPHTSLAGRTPLQFEIEIKDIPLHRRPQLKVADQLQHKSKSTEQTEKKS